MCSGHLEETELLLKWRSFQGLIQKSALQSTLEIPGHVELEGSHHWYRNRMRKRLENHRVTINAWAKMDSKVKTESRSLLLNIKYEKNYSPFSDLPICIYQLSISSMMIRPEDDPHTSPIVWSQNFKNILEITVSNFHRHSGSHHPFPSVLILQPLVQCILRRETTLLLGKPWLCLFNEQ